ncbi:hypothetical protein PCE1_004718 [Barthelona sp. PCE]
MGKPGTSEAIKVVARCRPLNSTERKDKRKDIVRVDRETNQIYIANPHKPDNPPKGFTFDRVYGITSTQQMVYEETAHPIVENVLEGYNGTILAYGQTGTGKTYTMEGDKDSETEAGVIPNTFKHIFSHIAVCTSDLKKFLVRCSFLEIYNNEIRDLLQPKTGNNLALRQTKEGVVFVQDLTAVVVSSAEEIHDVLNRGAASRSVGATNMNATSSRSHSIFSITVETCETDDKGNDQFRAGKLNLVDLAGSERVGKTGATGERLKEANNINFALLALGNVIGALVSRSKHIPYRDSKLTRLLQDSLGGNAKTCMVATLGPADWNYDETTSTLRYATRAKKIKNKPKINEDPKDTMIRDLQDEIKRLRASLMGNPIPEGSSGHPDQQIIFKDGEIQRVEIEKIVEVEVGVREEELNKRLLELENQIRQENAGEQQALLEEKARIEEEKSNIHLELERKQELLQNEASKRAQMSEKLKAMEARLLVGSVIAEKAKEQEVELYKMRKENEERRRQEALLAAQLAERQEMQLAMEEQYVSLQEECDQKTTKIKKLYSAYKAAKIEIEDQQLEFERDREELLDTIRELTQQLRLHMVMCDAFVPQEISKEISQRAQLTANGEWVLPQSDLVGNIMRRRKHLSDIAAQRPVSQWSNMMAGHSTDAATNARFRDRNYMSIGLDVPDYGTEEQDEEGGFYYEYEGVEDEQNEHRNMEYTRETRERKQLYPSARGLVKNKARFM